MTEQQTICPKCGFPSQGPRVRPHNCAARQAHPERYGGTPLSLVTTESTEEEDQVRGLQLEMQWERAVRGEAEQHIFGAMMILLEQHLSIESTRGLDKGGFSKFRKGTGVEAWLKLHAPKVKKPTAYRWKKATEGLLQKSGIADAQALQHLLGSDAADLAEPERRVQMELFATIEKSSQAELIEASPQKSRGGKTYDRENGKGARKQATAKETRELHRTVLLDTAKKLKFLVEMKAHLALDDERELDGWLDHLETALEQARGWKALTKAQRKAALADLMEDAA